MRREVELDGYIIKDNGTIINKDGSVKVFTLHSTGYLRTKICGTRFGNYCRDFPVHGLVAWAFLGYKFNLDKEFTRDSIVVDHINNDKLDNRVENLQLITNSENISRNKKYKGLPMYISKRRGRYRVQMNRFNAKEKAFDTLEEAKSYVKEVLDKHK